ncbi:MAG TPA: alpha/beta hydrolase [Orrella sp.]
MDFTEVQAHDYESALQATPNLINTRLGPVEYATVGRGPVILSVHGGPGGFDQGLALAMCFAKNGFQVIAPSRPGYLGTPLGTATNPQEQAAVLVALLDALELEQVIVVGASAGGPPTYALAQDHPDRVRALIEIDSVCMHYTKLQEISPVEQALYLSRPGMWVVEWLMRHFPAMMIKQFLTTEGTLEGDELDKQVRQAVADPTELAFVRVMMQTMSTRYEQRRPGLENDILMLTSLTAMPLDRIQAPTLIFHGAAERDVPAEQASYAAEQIRDAHLHWIDKGSHIGFWVSEMALESQKLAIHWAHSHQN